MPLFPLKTVVFPGASVPLHIFEDRYRALMRDVMEQPMQERVFAITAIREGYEVRLPPPMSGAAARDGERSPKGQSLFAVGTVVQVVASDRLPDGRYDIEVVGRSRIRLHDMRPGEEYTVAVVSHLEDTDGTGAGAEAARTLGVFERYRTLLSGLRGVSVLDDALPRDPLWLSWTLSNGCLLTLRQRQDLLECDDAATRLLRLRRYLADEVHAMRALPSLPATEVSRADWCPN